MTGGVTFKKSKIVLGNMASVSLVWQLMCCCVSVVICLGIRLVLGTWCGSTGVWVGGGYLWLVWFSK